MNFDGLPFDVRFAVTVVVFCISLLHVEPIRKASFDTFCNGPPKPLCVTPVKGVAKLNILNVDVVVRMPVYVAPGFVPDGLFLLFIEESVASKARSLWFSTASVRPLGLMSLLVSIGSVR